MFSLLQILAIILIVLIFYLILYQQFLKPLRLLQFYSKQGIHTQFIPLTGSDSRDSFNVLKHGDYYFNWLAKAQKSKLFCKNVGSQVSLILTDPELVKEMFINKDDFQKHPFQNALVRRLSPNGLVLSEGPIWKKHRKLISKGFQFAQIDQLLPNIKVISERLVGQLKQNKKQIISNTFNFFKESAGNIISLVYFQQNISSLKIDGKSMPVFLSDLIADLSGQSYNWKYCIFGMILVDLQIFDVHRKLLKDIRKMRQAVRGILLKNIELNKNRKNNGFSMWNIFINEENPNDGLNHEEIIDQFITFFSDGVYTTGHFMTMLTYHLSKNPEWKLKLRQELRQKLLNVEKPNQSLINGLQIWNACAKETLRLVPPVVTGIERIATKDTQFLDGTKILKGTMMMACHLVNHINPNLHQDPLTFNPGRWLDPNSQSHKSVRQNPGCFIPFSIGDRRCPGQKFAMAEAAIFMSHFLTTFDYEIVNEDKYDMKFTQRFLREPLETFGYKLVQNQ